MNGFSKEIAPIIQKLGVAGECAPMILDGEGICSTAEVIGKLRKWLKLPDNTTPSAVLDEAKKETKCESESCIYESPYVSLPRRDLETRFNPVGPWNSADWLSNVNIDKTLDNWQPKFPKFKHVEFHMMDFYDYGGKLATLEWPELLSKFTNLGCVLNTDTKGGPGRHWVCIFVDFSGRTVEYFDSAGQATPPTITKFLTTTAIALKFKDVSVTTMEHQKGDSECGVYSLFYILSRLCGVPYAFFEHTRIPDSDMENFRKYIFRHSK